jgi:hypothetical protein
MEVEDTLTGDSVAADAEVAATMLEPMRAAARTPLRVSRVAAVMQSDYPQLPHTYARKWCDVKLVVSPMVHSQG